MLAMLCSKSRSGLRLPWVTLVTNDLQIFFAHCPCASIRTLGSPDNPSNLDRWVLFIRSFRADWKRALKCVSLFQCILDVALSQKIAEPIVTPLLMPAVALSNVCSVCSSCFASSRALATHMRTKHARRSELRTYLDGTGKCPVCCAQFSSRIRCLAHVSEKRCRGRSQVSCRSRLQTGSYPALPADIVASLDAADALLRRGARKQGRSAPLVIAPARRTKQRAVPDCALLAEPLARSNGKRAALPLSPVNFRKERDVSDTAVTIGSVSVLSSPASKRLRFTHKHSLHMCKCRSLPNS